MELAGSTFTLRPYEVEDAESIAACANNVAIWHNVGNLFPWPYSLDHAKNWVAECARPEHRDRRFVIDVHDSARGTAELKPKPEHSAYTYEIGYWLCERLWGRGIATEAVAQLCDYAAERFGAERIEAFVYDWNPASERVLEKNGFVLEGRLRRAANKDGRWGDIMVYGRIRADVA